MAILAWATWASVSKSTSAGVTSFEEVNLSMRDFHVSARWKILPNSPSSFFCCVTCSVIFFDVSTSPRSVPSNITPAKMTKISTRVTPISFPNWRIGTRPMTIINKITKHKSAAVERFSNPIRGTIKAHTMRINLKAFLSAPWSVCSALSIWAVANTRVPLAISDGWNCIPMKLTHRCAPLVDWPAKKTQIKVMNEMTNMKGVSILKYLHFMLSVMTIQNMPINKIPRCLINGEK